MEKTLLPLGGRSSSSVLYVTTVAGGAVKNRSQSVGSGISALNPNSVEERIPALKVYVSTFSEICSGQIEGVYSGIENRRQTAGILFTGIHIGKDKQNYRQFLIVVFFMVENIQVTLSE